MAANKYLAPLAEALRPTAATVKPCLNKLARATAVVLATLFLQTEITLADSRAIDCMGVRSWTTERGSIVGNFVELKRTTTIYVTFIPKNTEEVWNCRRESIDKLRKCGMRRKTKLDCKQEGDDFRRSSVECDMLYGNRCEIQHDLRPRMSLSSLVRVAFFEPIVEIVGKCWDPVHRRDHAIITTRHTGTSSIGHVHVISVDEKIGKMRLEYSESRASALVDPDSLSLHVNPELGFDRLFTNSPCIWRERENQRGEFYAIIEELQVGKAIKEDRLNNLRSGDSISLPWRAIPSERMRKLLTKVSHNPAASIEEEITYKSISDKSSWRVIQVMGARGDVTRGVVLVEDRNKGLWKAIYDIPAGGSKHLNFPMKNLVVGDNRLFADLCTDCSYWGKYARFEIELNGNKATLLKRN